MKRRESFEQFVARVSSHAFILSDVEIVDMATKLALPRGVKKTDLKANARGRGSNVKYDEWFKLDANGEGDVLLLTQSEGDCNETGTVVKVTKQGDFDVNTNVMTSKIIQAARKRYLKHHIWRRAFDGKGFTGAKLPTGGKVVDGKWVGNGGGEFYLFVRKMTEEEKVEEDRKRAEAKAKLADKNGDEDEDEDEDGEESE